MTCTVDISEERYDIKSAIVKSSGRNIARHSIQMEIRLTLNTSLKMKYGTRSQYIILPCYYIYFFVPKVF